MMNGVAKASSTNVIDTKIGIVESSRRPPASDYYPAYNISSSAFRASKKATSESNVYNISLPIPRYIKPGKCFLHTTLHDFADSVAYFDRRVMDQQGLLNEIQVYNLVVDEEPPKLLDFVALTPLVVNLASGPVTVAFQATVQDTLAGVSYGYVGISGPGSSYNYNNYSHAVFDVPIGGQPVTFNASFTFDPVFIEGKGSYNIEVGARDQLNQYISLRSEELISLGFPGAIVLV